MRCPECKHDTLEPVYAEAPNPYLDDPSISYSPVRRELRYLLCTDCRAYYLAFGGESAERAYRRIIRDYATD
ncbi:MAG: hypothetical protein E7318_07270 [Clostridiales bacterium]|nr:hypothetical protein [Clostridiales bacterium]